mmetsp:Transcript_52648/g.124343  ORF Transcript_52648/g.124343 Transcript_52648/m.124343 type:complete len:226 (-) Transcript_52648:886-1563(-)
MVGKCNRGRGVEKSGGQSWGVHDAACWTAGASVAGGASGHGAFCLEMVSHGINCACRGYPACQPSREYSSWKEGREGNTRRKRGNPHFSRRECLPQSEAIQARQTQCAAEVQDRHASVAQDSDRHVDGVRRRRTTKGHAHAHHQSWLAAKSVPYGRSARRSMALSALLHPRPALPRPPRPHADATGPRERGEASTCAARSRGPPAPRPHQLRHRRRGVGGAGGRA